VSRHEGRTTVISGAALGLGRDYARRVASEWGPRVGRAADDDAAGVEAQLDCRLHSLEDDIEAVAELERGGQALAAARSSP
jgi:NAD(P)-dependent dehydrogenase (short-subunit alcohol dehydrogenase family)